jgi:hypothetical protein
LNVSASKKIGQIVRVAETHSGGAVKLELVSAMTSCLFMFIFLSHRVWQRVQPVAWRPIETTSVEWSQGRGPYTLIVEELEDESAEDSPRLRIGVPDGRSLIITAPGGLVTINDGLLLDQRLAGDNLLRSTYLYLTTRLKGPRRSPMLVVFGQAYASDPGSLRVLSLDGSGYPLPVFTSNTFDLTALEDTDGDGNCEIVGKHCLSQSWGKCFTTYDPYSVYRLPVRRGAKAVFSPRLSKTYNLKHYYGWSGPRCREDIAVVLCERKPRIMSAKEARRLYKE